MAEVEANKRKREDLGGLKLPVYPGGLLNDDHSHHGGDLEDNLSSNDHLIDMSSESDMSWLSEDSNCTFNSGKLFDGYADFVKSQ